MKIATIRILIPLNGALLVANVLLQNKLGDLNWLWLGDRSPISKSYMGIEAAMAMFLALKVFDYFYPDLQKIFTSKLTLSVICLFGLEATVWFLYR